VLAAILTALFIWVLNEAGVTSAVAVVGGAAAGVVMLGLALFGWNLAKYRFSGRKDDNWELVAGGLGRWTLSLRPGSAQLEMLPQVMVELHPRSPHSLVSDLRVMECLVRIPTGRVVTIPDSQIELRTKPLEWVLCYPLAYEAGAYEVRWYGSTANGRFYEVTRLRFDWTVPPPPN
jgi:hypothetical protein